MTILELINKRRTIRRFKQNPISTETLKTLVDTARIAPSAMNYQPLEFIAVNDPEKVQAIFPLTKWARYLLPEIGEPTIDQAPTAFIVILINKELKLKWTNHDCGAASENIILAALEQGIGTCWIASVEREPVLEILNVPQDQYELDCVIALGYPDEDPAMEDAGESIKYYKDENGRLHVPKRKFDDVYHENVF